MGNVGHRAHQRPNGRTVGEMKSIRSVPPFPTDQS
jgi:hypothetical protein